MNKLSKNRRNITEFQTEYVSWLETDISFNLGCYQPTQAGNCFCLSIKILCCCAQYVFYIYNWTDVKFLLSISCKT